MVTLVDLMHQKTCTNYTSRISKCRTAWSLEVVKSHLSPSEEEKIRANDADYDGSIW